MGESGVPDEPMRGRETLWSRFLVRSRARLERALRASERRFRVLSDSMPQLVWAARADATVDYYNARAREYGGLSQRPDGSWRWRPIVHPDDLERTMKAWHDAVACSRPYACEHRIRMADGTFRWHLSRAHLVREENGEARWYGTATDIDDQKRVEHALQVRERELAEALRTAEGAVRERDQLLSSFRTISAIRSLGSPCSWRSFVATSRPGPGSRPRSLPLPSRASNGTRRTWSAS